MADATPPPALKKFLFVADMCIEAATEEEALELFADDSYYLAENADCYEYCEKCDKPCMYRYHLCECD